MKFELPSKDTLIGLGLYAAFGYLLGEIAVEPELRTPGQWIATGLTMAILVYIDVRSYRQGLKRGCDIAHEVMDELLAMYRSKT